MREQLKTVFIIDEKETYEITNEIKKRLCDEIIEALKEFIFIEERKWKNYSKNSGRTAAKST